MVDVEMFRDVPDDPMGRLAASMTALVPEGMFAIVLLTDPVRERCMTHLAGYENDEDATADMVQHLQVVLQAYGCDLVVIPYVSQVN